MEKYDRYKGENLLINGLFGLLFGILPVIVILIILAVVFTIEGFTVAPNVLIGSILGSCFISVLLNTARINSKYKKNDQV
jgi:hypothetical protein|tara:strand:- start:500 stop:739 length:240 start_codon:yes stop_codon:yes gene_type:complete